MHIRDLYVFSSNPGKLQELQRAFGEVRVASLHDAVAKLPEVVEDGRTFEENARKKALAGAEACGKPTVADDSGLEVDALEGAPGVFSDRFAINHHKIPPGSDRATRTRANNQLLLELLETREDVARSARFVCALCCALPDELLPPSVQVPPGLEVCRGVGENPWSTVVARGTCEGSITRTPSGTGGFGYDPLFWSHELQNTFGASSPDEKRRVSHRGRATDLLISFLSGAGIL